MTDKITTTEQCIPGSPGIVGMEPFYFGAQGQSLLGLYHPASGIEKDSGVLICPPVFGEYMRTHGCLRHLANELAALGNHVLRFDYSGTGDSSGDIGDASISAWLDEIRIASKELQAISGVTNVTAIGVRLGAALAVAAAHDCPLLRRLVLWDPVDDGSVYLKDLNETYEALIASHQHLTATDIENASKMATGYALTEPLLRSIAALRIADSSLAAAESTSVLLTDRQLFDSGRWQNRTASCHFIDYDCNWPTFSESVVFGRPLIDKLAQQV